MYRLFFTPLVDIFIKKRKENRTSYVQQKYTPSPHLSIYLCIYLYIYLSIWSLLYSPALLTSSYTIFHFPACIAPPPCVSLLKADVRGHLCPSNPLAEVTYEALQSQLTPSLHTWTVSFMFNSSLTCCYLTQGSSGICICPWAWVAVTLLCTELFIPHLFIPHLDCWLPVIFVDHFGQDLFQVYLSWSHCIGAVLIWLGVP